MSDKIEYNDFGFAFLDADELKSVDLLSIVVPSVQTQS